jgi:hypothetical protein
VPSVVAGSVTYSASVKDTVTSPSTVTESLWADYDSVGTFWNLESEAGL